MTPWGMANFYPGLLFKKLGRHPREDVFHGLAEKGSEVM
jgi:hypothetical protein